ncbi:membrane protein insertase YidC [Cohaesibacter celericrescens]|uniref:Membrane protein insertase YidC n=1 Tax=Cohaesibacter celericrescens TaxID=2067669 RepID=A0A2N5XNY9_9HYPH|nr:membrane protein insertase YidC [Cohaesibacter celericrescens]PLW76195.1 membrane protein insertase YidC [Cohaesibacter celericrescens]
MENNRNFFLAIALSFVVLLGWQYFVAAPQMQAEKVRQEQIAAQQAATQSQTDAQSGTVTSPTGNSAVVPGVQIAGAVPQTTAAVLAQSVRIDIDTPKLSGSINLTGGRIDDLHLNDYRETLDKDSDTIVLLSPSGSATPYYAEFGWVAGSTDIAVPNANTVWSASDSAKLTLDTPLVLSWDNGAGLKFIRTITVDKNYLFSIDQKVENSSDAAVALYPYGLISRHGDIKTSGLYILHEGLIGVAGDDGLQEVDYKDLAESRIETPAKSTQGWVGITDKYWATAIIPPQGQSFQPTFRYSEVAGKPAYQSDYLGDAVGVAAGSSGSYKTALFAGAKEVAVLDAVQSTTSAYNFDLLIDWGWFYFLTKPMFAVIDYLYGMFGNFGVAILLVTVGVKAIFFPLANKSYASMSKMKMLQPKMEEIKKTFADNKEGQQKAIMELYKNEKVNPLAGCLPILIQIPVFFSLYKVLYITIEMRHAPFFGWIQDLSAPDPTNIFTAFGLIPWDPPSFMILGIWPLIMGITMFVQMKLNPAPTDPTQQMIFNWMPVIFTFMLATFPAGLVIYWAWNNSLSILQQATIMKKHGAKVEIFQNIKDSFSRKKKPE